MSTQSQQRPVSDGRTTGEARQPATTTNQPEVMAALTTKLLVTATEAACYLSVSRAHIYRLLQARELRAVHTSGGGKGKGAMRIPVSELTRYVERLLQAATDADETSR